MAKPRKLPSGRWRVEVMVDGQRHSRTFDLKRDAVAYEKQTKTDAARGVFIPPDRERAKVADRIDSWLDVKAQDPDFADSSWRLYEQFTRAHIKPHLGNLTMEHLGVEAIERWRNTLVEERGTASARKAHSILSSFCGDQVRYGYLPHNPVSRVKAPKHVQREMTVLEPHELAALADAIDGQSCSCDGTNGKCVPDYGHDHHDLRAGWAADVVWGLALVGCRIGDLAALRPEHWDKINDRLTVHDHKTKRTRTLPVFGSVREVLERCEARGGEFLFMADGQRGQTQLRREWSSTVFKDAVERAGIGREFVPHELRHTCASWLIRRGFGAVHVAAYLGHANPNITRQIYAHLFADDMTDLGDALHEMWQASHQDTNVTPIRRGDVS